MRVVTLAAILASLLAAALLGSASMARAVPVGPGSFGPGALVESFEGLATGPNVATGGLGPQYLIPGAWWERLPLPRGSP